MPNWRADNKDQLRVVVIVEYARARENRQRHQYYAFDAERDRRPAAGVMLEVPGEAAADHRSGEEAHERHHGGRHVDDGMGHKPEPEKDHVPGHVRDEHVAEDEHADRVDHAGAERQQQQPSHRQPMGDRRSDRHRACLTPVG
jgi:hypothetical protein